MQTILEFGDFYKDALALLGEDGYAELITHLAQHPEAGDVIRNTGGFRKLRFKRPGTGKRGGVRVVYFYYVPERPVCLYMIYAKGAVSDLTQAQKNWLREQADMLKGE